jgi:hypothetical protein
LTGGNYHIVGTLEFTGANIVTNSANIALAGTASQLVNSSTNASGLANFATNSAAGGFSVINGRAFTAKGTFSNAGSLLIGTGSSFAAGGGGSIVQYAGKTTDDGTLAAVGGINLAGGSLFGTGTITGALTSSGVITPGNSATSTGILTESGAYSQSSTGTLNVAIGGTAVGTQYDELHVGTAKLAGTLALQLINGYVPAVGSTFKVLGFNSETGSFATVKGLAINSAEHFSISYQGTDVLATVVSGAAAGSTAASLNATGLVAKSTISPGDSLARFRREIAATVSQSTPRFSVAVDRLAASGARGPARLESAALLHNPLGAKPRIGGKFAGGNVQISFFSLFARPMVSLGVN